MSDEIYFTRSSRRFARIGDTFTVVTEGAKVSIRLAADGSTAVTIAHEPDVRVIKRVVAAKPAPKPAAVKAAPAKPQAAAAKPRAAARTAAKPAAAPAKPRAAAAARTAAKPAAAKPAARTRRVAPEVRAEARSQLGRPARARAAAPQDRLAALRSRASA
jgi:hypothetical protein